MADEARTITVEIDGEAKEIPLPEGWVSEDDLRDNYMPKSMFRAELAKQTRKATEGMKKPDELLEDDDFLGRLIETRKDALIKRLGVKTGEPDEQYAQRLAEKIQEQTVKPLETKLAEKDREVSRWRERARDADIGEAFDAVNVADDYRDLIKLWARERMQFDDEHGSWVVLGEDGQPDFVVGEGGKPRPKGIADLLREIDKSGKKPGWFKGDTRPGVGIKDTHGRVQANTKKAKEMSGAEKTAFIAEHGLEAWTKKLVEERRQK